MTLIDGFPAEQWGVEVTIGPTPSSLANPSHDEGFMQMAPGEFLAIIDDVGRMHVTATHVTLDPAPGHDLAEMDYLLYGWAPRWIRILRSEFALHASAVVSQGQAIALMGFSGAGKSTTVTELSRRGFDLLIDDVLPVDFVDGIPHVHGWPRPVHLTDEAAEHFSLAGEGRVGHLQDSKISAMMPSVEGHWPLRLAIELEPKDHLAGVEAVPLTGAAKVQAVLNHSNGVGLSAGDGRALDFFAWATRVSQTIDVVHVARPSEGWHLDAVLEQITALIPTEGAPE